MDTDQTAAASRIGGDDKGGATLRMMHLCRTSLQFQAGYDQLECYPSVRKAWELPNQNDTKNKP